MPCLDKNLNDNKYNIINSVGNIAILIFTFLFLSYNTIIGLYSLVWIERLEILFGGILLIVLVTKWVIAPLKDKKKMILNECIVLIYIVVRILTIVKLDIDYSTIRTVFFECIYLLCISEFVLSEKYIKTIIMKLFMWLATLFNIVNMSIYALILISNYNSEIIHFLYKYTYLKPNSNYYMSTVYSNPNTFGIAAAFAILIAINLWYDRQKPLSAQKKFIIYTVFSIICVVISECRSAEVGLVLICVIYMADRFVHKINGKKVTIAALLLAVLGTLAGYGFMNSNYDTSIYGMTATEEKIDQMSTGRYFIWKSGYFAHYDDKLLGVGSLKREIELRDTEIFKQYLDAGYAEEKYQHTDLGPHNGYYSMIWCTGFIGFILFAIILLQKIRRSRALNSGNWYLAIIFVLTINLFESAFIVNRFFLAIYMFLILAMNEDDVEGNVS